MEGEIRTETAPNEEDVAMMMAAGFTREDAIKELWLAENGGDVLDIAEDGTEQPAPTFAEVLAQLEALPD